MNAKKSVAHRLGAVLEALTRQSGRLPETPEYGSWLLGKSSESRLRRRVRIQVILTVFILTTNVLGIAAALLLVAFAVQGPVCSATRLHRSRGWCRRRTSVWRC